MCIRDSVKEEADKEGKSLAPVAADLAAKLGQEVKFIPGVTRLSLIHI